MKPPNSARIPDRGETANPSRMVGSSAAKPSRRVEFTRMDQGTAEDYALLDELAKPYIAKTGDRVLAYLENLRDGLLGYRVDRYQHSLQTATRALRAGECEEIVVASLVHDIGDVLSPENHAELSAAVLRPDVATVHNVEFDGESIRPPPSSGRLFRARQRPQPPVGVAAYRADLTILQFGVEHTTPPLKCGP